MPLVLACFALLPSAQAVTPAPDGGYAAGNTAEGANALLSRTTGAFDTAIGAASLLSLTSGSSNTAVGTNSMRLLTDGFSNTAVGVQALFHNNGAFNTAVGVNALFSNTFGLQNTAVGQGALTRNTTGGDNVATGFQALSSNTTGDSNTATGFQALFSNTTGPDNTANGVVALFHNTTGDSNTGIGSFALSTNTTGIGNTACGHDGLGNNFSGSGNTAIGSSALVTSFNTNGNTAVGLAALREATASFNTALGFFSGFNLTTGNNNIDIGNLGVAGEANTIRIGNAVATLYPDGLTHSASTSTFIAGIRGRTTANANAVPVVIDGKGQLGTASSSRRFKNEIKPMDKTSEAILGLKPVTFHYKSDSTNTPQFGLIAEEVAKVNPDLVVRDENGEIYTVRYEAVNAMLLNEFLKEHQTVQELKSTAVKQEATISRLNATVARQETTGADQQKEIKALVTSLKEQAAQIQKVSARIEVTKPAPQMVGNNQ
jgi:uncharacterized coiled-coil protein SlyX